MNAIIARIIKLMKEHNYSAKKTTELLGVSQSTISEWKSGRIKPSIEHIIKLSQIFNVSTDYILTGLDKELSPEEQLKEAYDIHGDKVILSDEQEEYIKKIINQTLSKQVEAMKQEVLKELDNKKD